MRHLARSVPAHRAAPFLSQLVACGWIGRAEAIAALLHACSPVRLSDCGRRARLTVPVAGKQGYDIWTRSEAARAARTALQPLLQERRPRRCLIAAASMAAKPALSQSEIVAITNETIGRHLRTLRSQKRALPGGGLL